MKNQFLFFLLLLSSFSSAQIIQDWDLSPLGQRTYFERDNGFLEMYYNDSTEVFADYRKHYFGEKYTKDVLGGCYNEIETYLTQYYSDYFFPSFEENFAVEEWYSNDDFYYILNQNDTIKFHHKSPLGFSWKIPVIHDDFDEIKFDCVQITEQDVFGNLDSVRIFQITTFQNNVQVISPLHLRNINLSKKNGLLNFTPFYRWVKGYLSWTSEEQFNISGFEKNNEVIGLIPEFDLFFENYAIGDIFKWHSKTPVSFPGGNYFNQSWKIDSITHVSFFPDSLIEITFDSQFHGFSSSDGPYCDSIENQIMVYTKPDFSALFNTAPRHLFGSSNGANLNFNQLFILNSIKKNEDERLIFDIELLTWYQFDICEVFPFTDGYDEYKFESDIGFTYHYYSAINSDGKTELVGFKTNNIVSGNTTPVDCLTPNNNLTKEEFNLQIYPNPTSDYLNFIFSKNQNQPFSFLIYDALGKLVLQKRNIVDTSFNISKLKKGFYFVKISSSFGESVHKIMKH